ncbi:MAG: hypothetical protein JO296_18685, partial [Pseudonocardiales bacterium]|nr:hypothetical protein [Pseudonocardiales bacterium]
MSDPRPPAGGAGVGGSVDIRGRQAQTTADTIPSTAERLRPRPGALHACWCRAADDDFPSSTPTRHEWLFAEVARITERAIRAALAQHERLPAIDTPAWWEAPDPLRIPGLLIHAMAWLAHDCDREIDRRFKAMSCDLSAAHNWTKASQRPSFTELQRRRGLEF